MEYPEWFEKIAIGAGMYSVGPQNKLVPARKPAPAPTPTPTHTVGEPAVGMAPGERHLPQPNMENQTMYAAPGKATINQMRQDYRKTRSQGGQYYIPKPAEATAASEHFGYGSTLRKGEQAAADVQDTLSMGKQKLQKYEKMLPWMIGIPAIASFLGPAISGAMNRQPSTAPQLNQLIDLQRKQIAMMQQQRMPQQMPAWAQQMFARRQNIQRPNVTGMRGWLQA